MTLILSLGTLGAICHRTRRLSMPSSHLSAALFGLLLLGLCACSSFASLEQPTINVKAIHLLPGKGLLPDLAIDLLVSNPNSVPLPLRGFAYELSLNNHRVLSGVANQLPTIAAYGEAMVTLSATPDVLGSAELVQQLMQRPQAHLNYQLQGKLDLGLALPTLTLERTGELPISR